MSKTSDTRMLEEVLWKAHAKQGKLIVSWGF